MLFVQYKNNLFILKGDFCNANDFAIRIQYIIPHQWLAGPGDGLGAQRLDQFRLKQRVPVRVCGLSGVLSWPVMMPEIEDEEFYRVLT